MKQPMKISQKALLGKNPLSFQEERREMWDKVRFTEINGKWEYRCRQDASLRGKISSNFPD
jgi:hypothetical protein